MSRRACANARTEREAAVDRGFLLRVQRLFGMKCSYHVPGSFITKLFTLTGCCMAALRKPIAAPVLILAVVLLSVAIGCGSEPAQTILPTPAATETPAVSPTVAPTEADQSTEGETPGPTGQAGQENDRAPAGRPNPTSEPGTPTAVPSPTPTAAPLPTSTPDVVRVSESSAERETSPAVSDDDLKALIDGNTDFAFDLYRSVADGDSNLFFSPHSISTALAMAYAGARVETERQMSETLRFDLPHDGLHAAFNALDLSLVSGEPGDDPDAFRLNIANSVWGQQDYGFLPEFLDSLAVNYGDGVRPVDFQGNPDGSRMRINDWVAEATEERITDLIPQDAIDRYTRMVLANAIYFKAAWQHTFDEAGTTSRTFHLLDGSESEVPMMRQQARLRYANGDGYQAVELPYEGGNVAMTILLPDAGKFHQFEESLSGDAVDDILKQLENEQVRLTMPKFEVESAFSLAETLAAMGMPDAFDDTAANFSGMDGRVCRARGDICLLISDVLHKAFVSVDEAGTEAAAATAVIIGVTRAVGKEPVRLVVDRPFHFVIRQQATGAILFAGRVVTL